MNTSRLNKNPEVFAYLFKACSERKSEGEIFSFYVNTNIEI